MRPLFLLLLFLAVVGGQDIRDVDNHNALFHAISNAADSEYCPCTTENNIVPNGAIVRAAQGTYIGTPYSDSRDVYSTQRLFFSYLFELPALMYSGRSRQSLDNVHIRNKFSNTNHCWHDF